MLTLNKYLVPGLALLLLASCAGRSAKLADTGPSGLSADPLDRIVQDIVKNSAKFPSRKIVVYEFQDMAGDAKAEGRLVAERLTTKLVRNGGFEVIERSRLEAVLREHELSASGMTTERDAVKAGELLGAGAVVTGTLARVGGIFEINARVISVSNGRILAGETAMLPADSLLVDQEVTTDGGAAGTTPQSGPARQPGNYAEAAPDLPGWEVWRGGGDPPARFGLEGGKLAYYLGAWQNDVALYERYRSFVPALLLAKAVKGANWELEVEADYAMRHYAGHWFSLYITLGPKEVRPSRGNKEMAFSLALLHHADAGYKISDHKVLEVYEGEKIVNRVELPGAFDRFKIRRRGSDFTFLAAGREGQAYNEILRAKAPASARPVVQRVVLGSHCFGDPGGSYASYGRISVDGRPLF